MKHQAIEYKQEHFAHGEKTINGSSMWDNTDDYDKWFEILINP